MSSSTRCGVLLVNTGTPSEPRPRAIRKYLAQFLMDPRIRPMNRICWWLCLHFFILPTRGHKNASKYESIWTDEGSPFILDHECLAEALDVQFRQEGFDTVVRCAMSYGEPSVLNVLEELRDRGCSRLLVLPMYPQSAYSQAYCVKDAVERARNEMQWDTPCDIIMGYSGNPTYIQAIAASLLNAGFQVNSNDRILFSLHSIPMADIEAGDTYELQVKSSCSRIADVLGLDSERWAIGYQSRFDKGRDWLTPFTRDILAQWAETDTGRVFFICPNFAVDCLETLYDVEQETEPYYFDCLEQHGWEVYDDSFIYVPCLDRTGAHLKVLSDILRPYVKGIDVEQQP